MWVGTEIAKETPYYAGAFAAVLLTDSISANDALIFLAGANLGASVYEYGLAHAVRAFLRLKGAAGYASFENDWVPAEYLADYYSAVEPDELLTIAFLVDAMKDAKPGEPVLFFGVGPTLHHVFLAAGKASEIHLGDYLAANLEEIARWIACDRRAHDWRPFVRHTLECEGRVSASEQEIVRRETVTRAKITRLFEVDAACADPLGDRNTKRYGTVISAYCADSATSDRRQWEIYMKRIIGLVRPGGTFMTAALRRSRGYVVGGKVFPSADVDETDLSALPGQYFAPQDITIEVCDLPPSRSQGYSSIMLACARKKQAPPQRRNMRGLLKCST